MNDQDDKVGMCVCEDMARSCRGRGVSGTGWGGGRTLLEVGCVKPTEGGNWKIPMRWAEPRVGGEGFELPPNTPWGKRGSPEALPSPRSWFICL